MKQNQKKRNNENLINQTYHSNNISTNTSIKHLFTFTWTCQCVVMKNLARMENNDYNTHLQYSCLLEARTGKEKERKTFIKQHAD